MIDWTQLPVVLLVQLLLLLGGERGGRRGQQRPLEQLQRGVPLGRAAAVDVLSLVRVARVLHGVHLLEPEPALEQRLRGVAAGLAVHAAESSPHALSDAARDQSCA